MANITADLVMIEMSPDVAPMSPAAVFGLLRCDASRIRNMSPVAHVAGFFGAERTAQT
jgi:hypothetical protein